MGRSGRWTWLAAAVAVAVLVIGLGGIARPVPAGAVPAGAVPATSPTSHAGSSTAGYVVLYAEGTDPAAARAAVVAAGGQVVAENLDVGLASVRSSRPDFLTDVAAQPSLAGAARDRPTWQEHLPGAAPGEAPPDVGIASAPGKPADPAGPAAGVPGLPAVPAAPTGVPLGGLQWDMAMIGATTQGAFAMGTGSPQVLVGVVDTGIDAHHPDLRGAVDLALSRNFTRDDPSIDGPCEAEADHSCDDPVDVDDAGHGTHVAGTIGAALNGIGTAGVAPGVRLVNLRAGQDSGYFFLKPVLDAITYAADAGVDVLNLSFFTDPWLFNCPANPADSAAEQLEQRTVVAATQRAVDYAWARGVTLVAALGNEHTDLARPSTDATSPDLPPGASRVRAVDDSCVKVPTELDHVIGVGAVGPSGKKADYSNYGSGQADLVAPGGFFRDFAGTPSANRFANEVQAPYPAGALEAEGVLDETGAPRTPDVVRQCTAGTCAYWRFLQGTSMAAPHVSGVAALVVSRFGHRDASHGGLTMDPAAVERVLLGSARPVPCPAAVVSYTAEGRAPDYDARCVAGPDGNGVYGAGVVDAAAAVSETAPPPREVFAASGGRDEARR
jgi:subtilisin family serine protease